MIEKYTVPTLIYVESANAKFPQVEGFMVYTSGDGNPKTAKKIGFQMKKSDVKPRDAFDTGLVNGGAVLIRGRSVVSKPRAPKAGWEYMSTTEVREFLGNSLLLAIPRDMLVDPLN